MSFQRNSGNLEGKPSPSVVEGERDFNAFVKVKRLFSFGPNNSFSDPGSIVVIGGIFGLLVFGVLLSLYLLMYIADLEEEDWLVNVPYSSQGVHKSAF